MLDQPDIRARVQATAARALIDLPAEESPLRQFDFVNIQGKIDFALEIGAITHDERVEFFNQLRGVI